MRIIIEIEGEGSAQPDIVLRSSSAGQTTTSTPGKSPGTSPTGGIDAGAAPTGDSSTQALGTVVTPSSSVSDAAGASSAGAAPSSDAGG